MSGTCNPVRAMPFNSALLQRFGGYMRPPETWSLYSDPWIICSIVEGARP
jgi:hypothetical protein